MPRRRCAAYLTPAQRPMRSGRARSASSWPLRVCRGHRSGAHARFRGALGAVLILLQRVPERHFGAGPLAWLTGLGTISYSFYLLHQPVILLLSGWGHNLGLGLIPVRRRPGHVRDTRRRDRVLSWGRATVPRAREHVGGRARHDDLNSGAALEEAGDRPVLEHLHDRPRDERGDRRNSEFVELSVDRDRQGVGDDDFASARCPPVGRPPGQRGSRGSRRR